MPVSIHNKDYWTVAERIAKLREDYPLYTVETQLILQDDEKVIMKALIFADKTICIVDGQAAGSADEPHLIAIGYAEEVRSASSINSTSCLENAETSAVGRALAFFGLAGTEIASADEVAAAITQQREKELYTSFQQTTEANESNHGSLLAIREFLAEENWSAAKEAWTEVSHDDQRAIWVATTKGGWFTTAERHLMKTWPDEEK